MATETDQNTILRLTKLINQNKQVASWNLLKKKNRTFIVMSIA